MRWRLLKDLLFIDQDTKKVSSSQFWRNVGLMLNCVMFPYAVIHGAGLDIWIAFGSIVIGSHGISQFTKYKMQTAR